MWSQAISGHIARAAIVHPIRFLRDPGSRQDQCRIGCARPCTPNFQRPGDIRANPGNEPGHPVQKNGTDPGSLCLETANGPRSRQSCDRGLRVPRMERIVSKHVLGIQRQIPINIVSPRERSQIDLPQAPVGGPIPQLKHNAGYSNDVQRGARGRSSRCAAIISVPAGSLH